MTPEEFSDQDLPALNKSIESVEAVFAPGDVPKRDDMSLCHLCLRWTSGDHDCSNQIRCDLQLVLDELEEKP